MKMMPLNALRSFDAAARHLSLAAAAAELGVTAAAVSIQVRRLEDWIGVPLFHRGNRTITLSKAGQRLAPQLKATFGQLERLLSDIAELDATSIQISAMQTFASRWLAPRLGRFVARRPDIQVRISGADRRADFERDGVDVGLRYGDGDYGDLHAELISKVFAFPVCSPALAARFGGDPASVPNSLLLHDEAGLVAPGLPTWSDWFAQAGAPRDPQGGPLFSNSHMALSAAMSGQGFALGLSPLVEADLAAGRLVRPFALQLESNFSFWFVCRPDRLQDQKIAAFRAWLLSEAAVAAADLAAGERG